MRAVWVKESGGPDVPIAGEAPEPSPGPGEALVEVAYATITLLETQVRAGSPVPFHAEPPVIPGDGVGGVAGFVGAHVDTDVVGEPVVSSAGGSGGHAERVAVPADGLVEVPGGVQLDSAVALLAGRRTAMSLVRRLRPLIGATVPVAAGGRCTRGDRGTRDGGQDTARGGVRSAVPAR